MATNNYMPMGRNPRSGGAGQAASYKKGGSTKVAGVMKSGGAKYQKKSIVTTTPAFKNTKPKPSSTTSTLTQAQKDSIVNSARTFVKGAKTQNGVKGVITPYEVPNKKKGGSMRGKKC